MAKAPLIDFKKEEEKMGDILEATEKQWILATSEVIICLILLVYF